MDFNQKDSQRSSLTIMVVLASIMIASIFQIATWDKYALDIIPYQIRGAFGMTSPQDWEDQSKMCWELRKWDCVESNYTQAAQADGKHYPRLGHYLMRRLKFDKASQAFRSYINSYINNSGDSPWTDVELESAAAYAKALGEIDQFEDSIKYFNLVLESRPNSSQIPVVLSFVKVLMKAEKYGHALRLIEQVRRQNQAGSQFMEAEYNQIKNLKTASR